MTAVLDAWAVIAYLMNASGAGTVEAVIEKQRALMSWLNVGEVYYTLMRREDEQRAKQVVAWLRSRVELKTPTSDLVLKAAAIKATNSLSYADAFAVATAQQHQAELLTGDPEIIALGEIIRVVDLRG